MRKRFVYIVLVSFIVFVVVVALFVDSWIESGLEYTGEQIVGARVEIDGLSVGISPLGLAWDRLQVADPSDTWKNLFETGSVGFSVNAGQLLRAKVIVESMRVEGFVLGTERESDGKIVAQKPPKGKGPDARSESVVSRADKYMTSRSSITPIFDLDRIRRELNLDSLVNPSNLETYRLVDSLEKQLGRAEQEWRSGIAELRKTQQQVSVIEGRVRSIDVGAINSVQSAQSAFSAASEAYTQTRGVVQAVDEKVADLTAQLNGFSSQILSLDDAASRDYAHIISQAKLPDMTMGGLAELVLGKTLFRQAHQYLSYVDLARRVIPARADERAKTPDRRSEGVTIHFPKDGAYPKLWIKEVVLSGGSDTSRFPNSFYAYGSIHNITNDQQSTGQPITGELELRKGERSRALVRLSFDRRNEQPHDRYGVDISGIAVTDLQLGTSSFLPSHVSGASAEASVKVDMSGSVFESSARFDFSSVRVQFDRSPQNAVERLTRDVLTSIRSFFVRLRLWRPDSGDFDVEFRTDLDDLLSGQVKRLIGGEVSRLRNDIRRRVASEISKKRRSLEELYNTKRSDLQKSIAFIEKDMRTKVAFVEAKKKELEDRIAQEKKKTENAAKKKAGDVLKGILRKHD